MSEYEIYKDCKWYQEKYFSVGDIDWCDVFEEELVLGANDCKGCGCGNYEKT